LVMSGPTIRELLNDFAERYAKSDDASAKRQLLVDYLECLQMEATQRGYAWSTLRSSSGPAIDNLKPDDGDKIFYDLRPIMDLQEALLQINNREKPNLFHQGQKLGKPEPSENVYWRSMAAGSMTILI